MSFLLADVPGLSGLRESILARTREAASFAIALVVGDESAGLVIERERFLATSPEHEIHEGRANALHLRVVVPFVEAGHRPADLRDCACDGGMAERSESGAILLLMGLQTCHGTGTSAGNGVFGLRQSRGE